MLYKTVYALQISICIAQQKKIVKFFLADTFILCTVYTNVEIWEGFRWLKDPV